MTIRYALPILLASLAGCGESGPPLVVSNVVITAPLPGRANSVAYMTVQNQSAKPVVLTKFSSPQFRSIEIHETAIEDGIASMFELDSVSIDARSRADFVTGGKHLMLLDPTRGLAPGKPVSIEIHYDDGGLLIVSAPLSTRMPTTEGN